MSVGIINSSQTAVFLQIQWYIVRRPLCSKIISMNSYFAIKDSYGFIIRAANYIFSRGVEENAAYPILVRVEYTQAQTLERTITHINMQWSWNGNALIPRTFSASHTRTVRSRDPLAINTELLWNIAYDKPQYTKINFNQTSSSPSDLPASMTRDFWLKLTDSTTCSCPRKV